jgi:ankyrin repeat protein
LPRVSLLEAAAGLGLPEITKILLKAGADLKRVKVGLRDPLLYRAIYWNSLDTVKLLIEAGANPDDIYQGQTAVEYAQACSRRKIVKFLREIPKRGRNLKAKVRQRKAFK